MLRIIEEFGGGRILDDLAAIHEDHPVGDAPGEPHLVRHHQHRHATFGKFDHGVEHFLTGIFITLTTWVMVAMTVGLLSDGINFDGPLIKVLFNGIAALTVPHMLLIDYLGFQKILNISY